MAPLHIIPWQMLIGGAVLAVSALLIEGLPDIKFSPTLFAVLAYNGPIASAFCFWAYLTVMRSLPVTSTTLGSLGVPVAGMLFSALTLGEVLSISKVSGLALISSGVVILIAGDIFWKSRNEK